MFELSVPALGLVLAFATGVLALSLFVASSESGNPFVRDGHAQTWGKCAGIVIGSYVVGLVPGIGGLLTLVGWFAAVMYLFELTFLRALLMLVANGVLTWFAIYVLTAMLRA